MPTRTEKHINDTERPLPENREAEAAILGGILLDNAALNTAAEILKPADFYLPENRKIYDNMVFLASEGDPIDLVTLTEQLNRTGQLESAGGPAYLAQLLDGRPRIANIRHYASIVREKAAQRAVIHLADAIQEQAFDEADPSALLERALHGFEEIRQSANGATCWRPVFHTYEDFKEAPPLRMAIDQILQLDGATFIAGLPEHGKTWVMLCIAKAALQGSGKLWGHFNVRAMLPRVVYLIPESTLAPFNHRIRLLGMLPFVENERLLVRTLSLGPKPDLADPRILAAAKGSLVILDTIVRFNEGDENKAGDFQALATKILGMLGAGALAVLGAQHSPKSFEKEREMTLENMLRGSGDIGATPVAALGMKVLDDDRTIIHIEALKARDFQRTKPFQLIGRPFIDQDGDFRMHKGPGDCGRLNEEILNFQTLAPDVNRERQNEKTQRLAMVRSWIAEDPGISAEQIQSKFKALGVDIARDTAYRYRKEAE